MPRRRDLGRIIHLPRLGTTKVIRLRLHPFDRRSPQRDKSCLLDVNPHQDIPTTSFKLCLPVKDWFTSERQGETTFTKSRKKMRYPALRVDMSALHVVAGLKSLAR